MKLQIWRDISAERVRQIMKWGKQVHNHLYWLGILTEEVGEVAKQVIENKSLRNELIQVAAVVVAWIEMIDNKDYQE